MSYQSMPAPVSTESAYHSSVLETLCATGACNTQQLDRFHQLLRTLTGECASDAPEIWRFLSRHVLLPSHDFDTVHRRLAGAVYDSNAWPAAVMGRPPLWIPDPAAAAATNVGRFLAKLQHESWWRDAGGGNVTAGQTAGDLSGLSDWRRQLEVLMGGWALLQRLSWEQPEEVWSAVLKELRIQFAVPPSRMLQRHPTDPDAARWLPGARLNVAHAALHCPLAPPGAPALLWARDGAPTRLHAVGREELRRRVEQVAASVRQRFKPGDPIALYLPMTPDAVVCYLGVVLAGCVAVSVADSFSAAELRTRLDIAGARGVFTQDVVVRGGKALPLYDKVVQCGTTAAAVVLPAAEDGALAPGCPPLRPWDFPFAAFTAAAATSSSSQPFQPYIADAYDTTNVLFSSGTTGEPKAIPWTHVTPLRCAVDGWAQLDVRPGSVVAWPTNLGWMMGPWLLYASLLNGATVALYTGAPLGRDFGQFLTACRAEVVGLVPSIVRAWRQGGALQGPGVDLGAVRVWGSTGEASAAEDYHWLMSRARGYRPVVEYCGGTEIGGGYISSTLLHPCAPSTFTTPTLGTRLVLLSPQQSAAAAEGTGSAMIVPENAPTPPGGEVALAMPMFGVSQRLLNRNHTKVYYDGMPPYGSMGLPLRRHGDEMARLAPPLGCAAAGACYCALGRCDDTMNLGGIKVSSVELERAVVEGVPGVAEAAAVGVAAAGGGPEELVLFLVLRGGAAGAGGPGAAGAGAGGAGGSPAEVQAQLASLHKQCQAAVRSKLNPLFKVTRVVVRASLPRNASNKVMRRVLRDELPNNKSRL